MDWSFVFFLNSILLGVGLAMDAFSVSMANGLGEPNMPKSKLLTIAATFGGFQALMPMIGWACVHTIAEYFTAFQKFIPYIALLLLGYIGGKMLIEGIRSKSESGEVAVLTIGTLIVQGVATSIDALSVGFTIVSYTWLMALASAVIIAVVTFIICVFGVIIGKKFGTALSNRAQIFGGIILIGIGIEIFISSII